MWPSCRDTAAGAWADKIAWVLQITGMALWEMHHWCAQDACYLILTIQTLSDVVCMETLGEHTAAVMNELNAGDESK